MLESVHPGAINISWQPPPEGDQNGPLIYIVQYTNIETGISMNKTVFFGATLALSALDEFTEYSIRVAAVTVNGTGPFSNPVNGTGPFSNPVNETSGHEGKLDIKMTDRQYVLLKIYLCT